MSNQYAVVMTTTASHDEADKIANALLSQRLAACVQVTQIKSYYTWQGSTHIDDEQILFIKCKQRDFSEIEACIKEHHSYEIPEIIQVPITAGLPAYLSWIDEVTK